MHRQRVKWSDLAAAYTKPKLGYFIKPFSIRCQESCHVLALTKLCLKPTSCEEHGYLFSGMKKWIRTGQLMARVKAGVKALENVSVTSPSGI
jgi:hypothetical protein